MLSLVLMSLRRGWRALPVVAFFFAHALSRAQPPEIAGTFPEDYLPALKSILDTALRQSPQVIAKQLELEATSARVYGADSLRLPNVGGNLSYASNETAISSRNSTSSRDSGAFYNFGVTQTLYHWGALKHEGDKARLGVLIAQKSYVEAMRALAVMLRGSYLELIVKKSHLRQMRFARDLRVAELALANEKLKDGLLSDGDIAGRKLNLSDLTLQTARAEIEFGTLRRKFGRLAGTGDLPEDAIPAEIPKPVYPAAVASALLASVMRDGGRQTFQAQVSELKVREADLNYRIARVRLLPKFNAGVSYSLENTTNASTNSVSQQGVARRTAAVSAQWNIFDGFATKGAKLEALASKRANERQLQNSAEAATDAAQSLVQQLELDVQAMEMSDLRYGLAAAQVAKLQEELKLGNVAQTAIDDANSQLKLNEVYSASARATFLSRWSEFASFVGADPILNQLPARHDREKR